MSHFRAFTRLARLLGVMVACIIPHSFTRNRGQSSWPRIFLARAARATGFDVQIEGTPLLHDVFFIANHISWIDILSLGGVTGCAFISKDGIEKAPLVGWLAAQNNTIFVARTQRGAVTGQIEAVRTALAAHQPIALFPEGTTGDGHHLLPFKPALFSVLLPPPRSILIQPVVIDYGDATSLVAWMDGESGVANALRILGARGRRKLKLRFLDPFDPGDHPDRKLLAAESHARISAAMRSERKAH